MKLIAIHTCPLWEESDGRRRIGMEQEVDHPPLVGWVNVLTIRINGEDRDFLWSGVE